MGEILRFENIPEITLFPCLQEYCTRFPSKPPQIGAVLQNAELDTHLSLGLFTGI